MTQIHVTKDLMSKKLVLEFTIEGPLDQVWRAHTEKELFEKWWGPVGWQTTAKKFEFKLGGKIHFCMKCTDELQKEWFGKESWGIMEIIDIVPKEKIVFTDNFTDETGDINPEIPSTTVTNEFASEQTVNGEITRVISTCVANEPEQIEQLVEAGIVEGYSSQLVKLDDVVSSLSNSDQTHTN